MRVPAIGHRRAVLSVVLAGLLATAVVAPGASFAAPTRVVQQGGGAQLKGEWDEVLGEESVLLARVERARAEARRKGLSCTEQVLTDGSIRLTIQVNGGVA